MATRQETARRRAALEDHLRTITTDGTVRAGDPMPSLRTLGARFGLSAPLVAEVIRPWVRTGVIRTVATKGMYFAGGTRDPGLCLLWVTGAEGGRSKARDDAMRLGFERRVTELGGVCAVVDGDQLEQLLRTDDGLSGLRLSGVFSWDLPSVALRDGLLRRGIPLVRSVYGPADDGPTPITDLVGFDDLAGGRAATRHLLQQGFDRIAFLGFHVTGEPAARHLWSREREQGWREAVLESSPESSPVTYCVPGRSSVPERAAESAARAAHLLVADVAAIEAVVGADDVMVLALVEELRAQGVPPAEWPAMVGFEGLVEAHPFVTTTMYMDRERVGEDGAQLLHDRVTNRYEGETRTVLAEMTLVSRVTSLPRWGEFVHRSGLGRPHAVPEVSPTS